MVKHFDKPSIPFFLIFAMVSGVLGRKAKQLLLIRGRKFLDNFFWRRAGGPCTAGAVVPQGTKWTATLCLFQHLVMAIDRRKVAVFGAAFVFRLLLVCLFPSLPDLLTGRVEVSTPVNSFKRRM